jgi:hypothetical protein
MGYNPTRKMHLTNEASDGPVVGSVMVPRRSIGNSAKQQAQKRPRQADRTPPHLAFSLEQNEKWAGVWPATRRGIGVSLVVA